MDMQGSVQRQFGPVAAAYATSGVHKEGPELTAMLAAADLQGNERVLDIACGAGHTALAFAAGAADVVAVDVTEAMLATARRLAAEQGIANVAFQPGDAEALPFPVASFDLITCRYAAHHFAHPAAAAREWARVLKPAGSLLLVDIIAPDDPAADTVLNAAEILRDPSHVRDYRIAEWLAMFEAAGLTMQTLGQWPLRLPFASWTERMRTPPPTAAQIVALFAGARPSVRETLSLEPDGTFTCPVALLRGRHRN